MRDDASKIFFQSFLLEIVMSSSGMGRDSHCPACIFSVDWAIAYPPGAPEGWFWRVCHGV